MSEQQEDARVSGDRSEDVEDVEAEREHRLSPENRPENAEVDNTDAHLPTVEAWYAEHGDEAGEGTGGTADPSKKFREMEVSEEEKREVEEERQRRLDPENRPENAEVDNTDKIREAASSEPDPTS